MNKIWIIDLTPKGFSKLNYYIEEEIIEEFNNPLNLDSSLDAWVNGILAEISRNPWPSEDKNFSILCHDIYPLISTNNNEPEENFIRAIDFILDNNLVYWNKKEII